ncbi:katanin p80 WD40 repeat-containing subunit B1 homolog KTN80.2-like isoform X2 [Impatiens glandulifera]|nr:katanin p80 WD40 repeat-containing subunit B1 homolog KTN80.2-like isoform X2 [Impatiens glandulifera]
MHTYTGHSRGISTIKFSPDGRWVVSGGYDNIVKIWDLTAGKLLHDFKYHEGHIRSLDFHPLEFLLATGSADKTVKFWDLETFELIGSTRPETSSVCSITFHPDGRTLFCGLEDSLKIYSWEPVICHDALEIGWSKLSDLTINEGKLLGCSYYQNSVGVWASDISLIEPYRVSDINEKTKCSEQKHDLQQSSPEKVGNHRRAGPAMRSMSPEYDSKEIKNIYVDSEKPVSSKRIGRANSKGLVSSYSKESSNIPKSRQGPTAGAQVKTFGQANTKSFIVPNVVLRDSSDGKATSKRESISNTRVGPTVPSKPLHARSISATVFDTEKLSVAVEPEPMGKVSNSKGAVDLTFNGRSLTDDDVKETAGKKHLNVKDVSDKLENVVLHQKPSHHEAGNEHVNSTQKQPSVRHVNGVTVVRGRTLSLVERFERRDEVKSEEIQVSDISPILKPEITHSTFMLGKQPQMKDNESQCANEDNITEELVQNHDVFLSTLRGRLTKLQVLRHFWERNDIKGAIDAMRKLPDHSVQADMMSVLMEKTDILTLDTFQFLLPLLSGLLDSKTERHASISLGMLLKLVAVFGPVIHSAISARPAVGVNLHAEERIECCKKCNVQLQNIQKNLPELIRRGGLVAKGAMELNLVLQQT